MSSPTFMMQPTRVRRGRRPSSASLRAALWAVMLTLAACGQEEDCDRRDFEECDAQAFAAGRVNIQPKGISAFAASSADLVGEMEGLDVELESAKSQIALSLQLDPESSAPQILMAIGELASGVLDGPLALDVGDLNCSISIHAFKAGAARCDHDIDWSSAIVSCDGTCSGVDPIAPNCGVDGELLCRGTPPELACTGNCDGVCVVPALGDGVCEGTCRGTCTGTCTTFNAQGDCEGACDGNCSGACAVEGGVSKGIGPNPGDGAGSPCNGLCEGSCSVLSSGTSCEGLPKDAASCLSVGGAVPCATTCVGEAVAPPELAVHCRAAVSSRAAIIEHCEPPRIAASTPILASADLIQAAQFQGWFMSFRRRYAALLASRARAQRLLTQADVLVAAIEGELAPFVAYGKESADWFASLGSACADAQLMALRVRLESASQTLSAQLATTDPLVAALGE